MNRAKTSPFLKRNLWFLDGVVPLCMGDLNPNANFIKELVFILHLEKGIHSKPLLP